MMIVIYFFNKRALTIYKNNKKILAGVRNKNDGLWDIPMESKMQSNNFEIPSTSPGFCKRKTLLPLNKGSKRKLKTSKNTLQGQLRRTSTTLKRILQSHFLVT